MIQDALFRATPNNSFNEFWSVYPRKVGKGAARRAWVTAIKNGAEAEQVILAAKLFASEPRELKFTPHPATWLNGERWLDEPEAPARPKGYEWMSEEGWNALQEEWRQFDESE